MLTKEEKLKFRSELFRHLDGLVVAPIAHSLNKAGVCNEILQSKSCSLETLAEKFNANSGYLNVALRVLAAQGWINYAVSDQKVHIEINDHSKIAFAHFDYYDGVVDLLKFSGQFHSRKFELAPFQKLEALFTSYQQRMSMPLSEEVIELQVQEQILKHIEGHLVSPTIVRLGMGGMFHKYFMEASFSPDEYHAYPESFEKILDFLSSLDWFFKKNNTYRFSDKGLFFAKRSSAYGVTVSYLPMFRNVDELCFGDPNILWPENYSGPEIHVDREMNVWGSGGAHSSYFKKIDHIIIDIFNRPIEQQPKGILDMGCGNGAFLIHLFEVIEKQTKRGELLDDYPLFLVGVDYNKAALKVTRANLIQADIWAKVIWGDISNPKELADNLKEDYNIELADLLNTRTFLDHNRIWSEDKIVLDTSSKSTGAFASRGKRLSGNDVEQNLKYHLESWRPYIQKHGLIAIELHTINPMLTAKHLGKTAATAYDATHGFSDQYILELDAFQKVVKELGLKWNEKHFHKFPNNDTATVSIHHLSA